MKTLSNVSVTIQRHSCTPVRCRTKVPIPACAVGKRRAVLYQCSPDFDQILRLRLPVERSPIQSESGSATYDSGRMNSFGKRLMEGDSAAAEAKIGTGAAVKIR
jgi:hypothetical protein